MFPKLNLRKGIFLSQIYFIIILHLISIQTECQVKLKAYQQDGNQPWNMRIFIRKIPPGKNIKLSFKYIHFTSIIKYKICVQLVYINVELKHTIFFLYKKKSTRQCQHNNIHFVCEPRNEGTAFFHFLFSYICLFYSL